MGVNKIDQVAVLLEKICNSKMLYRDAKYKTI
jgi:hypothetical protein